MEVLPLKEPPGFILTAIDPLSSDLIRIWANIRRGNTDDAFAAFQRLLKIAPEYDPFRDDAEEQIALAIAWNITDWRVNNVE